jgi:hypothetical protein
MNTRSNGITDRQQAQRVYFFRAGMVTKSAHSMIEFIAQMQKTTSESIIVSLRLGNLHFRSLTLL